MSINWIAQYNDGVVLSQFNEDGTENKYSDIDRERLERFVLLDGDQVRIVLNMDHGKKLIYRRRVAKSVLNNLIDTVHIVGYQEAGRGQTILFLFESSGHIEVTDGFKEDHKWFYPVRFLPEERV